MGQNRRHGSAEMIATESRLETGVYPKRQVAVVRGAGARVWDAEGREFLDCVGGHGVANLGHCHPAIVAAVQEQASRLLTCPEIFHNDQRAAYLEELAAALPFPSRIFFCNSGAESIEASIKFARLITERPRIVAAKRGFHGRTLGALSATWEPKYREPFIPLIPGFVHVPYDDPEALEAAVDDLTAAVILEPVQGEGGVRPASPGYLAAARRICDAHGALLILDEVQTGFGRIGHLFAIERDQVIPDILTLAKSIAGGLPMGATVVHERHGPFSSGVHGTTFGGGPVVCAAARAVLRVMQEERIPQQAAEKGQWLIDTLRGLNLRRVREVRGLGLLVGLELKERVQPFLAALLDRGVLALPAGPTVLRLLPPLVISYDDLDTVVQQIRHVMQ
ncbi:MAG: aspartate aminotransferase family protein [Chloroflexaceae bacterium]|nr:aspartate aminotransferase family protein [Chloroflexaceae bacterium]